jgi:hypothetical protein
VRGLFDRVKLYAAIGPLVGFAVIEGVILAGGSGAMFTAWDSIAVVLFTALIGLPIAYALGAPVAAVTALALEPAWIAPAGVYVAASTLLGGCVGSLAIVALAHLSNNLTEGWGFAATGAAAGAGAGLVCGIGAQLELKSPAPVSGADPQPRREG